MEAQEIQLKWEGNIIGLANCFQVATYLKLLCRLLGILLMNSWDTSIYFLATTIINFAVCLL